MARDRDSYIHRIGMTPNTQTVISSKNRIYAFPADDATSTPVQVGVIATFDPSESRTIEPIRGIGYGDQVAELIPGLTEPMSITVTRAAQYLSLVFQTFGYKGGVDGFVRSLKHHRWPFDIRQELVFSELAMRQDQTFDQANLQEVTDEHAAEAKALITIYEACWFSDYGTSFASDTSLVQENVTLMVSDILADGGHDYNDNEDTGNSMGSKGSIRFMGGNGGPFPQSTAGNL